MATAARKKAEPKMAEPNVLPNTPDFTIGKTALFDLLERLYGVVERKNTIPILGHFLLAAVNGKLVVKATDLDREAEEFTDVKIAEPGALTVNAQALYDSVKRVKAGADLRFEAIIMGGERLKMTSGRMSAELFCLPANDFPSMGGAKFTHQFEIEDKALVRLLKKASHAISTEETRYYLNGIYLHSANGVDGKPRLRAVSTDGHQLAMIDTELPSGATGIPGVIMPSKLVKELIRIIGNGTGDAIKVDLSNTKVRFRIGAFSITSKLIDGEFPDYARVIPEGNKCKAVIDAADSKAAVEFVRSKRPGARAVGLKFSENELRIYRNSYEDEGTAQDFVEIEYRGQPIDVGFNSTYLLNVIDLIDGEKLVAKLADASSPAVFLDDGDDGVLYVIMPMRI